MAKSGRSSHLEVLNSGGLLCSVAKSRVRAAVATTVLQDVIKGLEVWGAAHEHTQNGSKMRGRKRKAGDQRKRQTVATGLKGKRGFGRVPAGEENCSSTLLQPSVMMNDCFPTRLHSVSLDTEHLNTLVSSPGRESGSVERGYDHAQHSSTVPMTSLHGHRTDLFLFFLEGNQS